MLKGIGAPLTPENVRFMNAWGQAEGGGGYGSTGEGQFNWLNTRRGAGSNWNQPNFQTGVHNTIGALEDGYYPNIVAGLRSGRATAQQLATMVANSKWGTHAGVLRVLGAGPVQTGTIQGPGAQATFSTQPKVSLAPPPSAAPTPAPFTPSTLVVGQLFQSMQNTLSGHPDMSGLLALASARAQYQASIPAPSKMALPAGQPEAVSPAHGQMTFSGYLNPIPRGSVFERNDQGVDFRTTPGSAIPVLGNARVVRVSNDAGGFGKAIYYQLLDGPQKGRYVYVGHADPMAQPGQLLRAGQMVARSRQRPYGNAAGTPGHIEMGWAGSPFGPLGSLESTNVGADFHSFINSLGG